MTQGYHYKGCGLDYVYLVNGYKVHTTSHGKGVSIIDADGLHRAIAITLITSLRPICGQEVRFLRSLLDMSQGGLAQVLKVQRLQVTRWEKENRKPISGTADVALRLLVANSIAGNSTVAKLIEMLKEDDERKYRKQADPVRTSKLAFEETDEGWLRAAAA